ncbi:MAG: CPBP family intramembrane glutamic endopeptidase [Bacteroidia bacterium]|nr:CPBP family intramembrane glutamic endopeptidase [Bacteroidia bacterium]
MKPLFLHVWNYSKEQFRWQLYLPIAIFLLVIFSFNYSLDFEDQYIDTIRNYPARALAYTTFLLFPFLFAAFCISKVKKADFLRKREFWLKVIIAFVALGLYRAIALEGAFCQWLEMDGCRFVWRVLRRFNRLILFFIPLLIFWPKDRQHLNSFYGMKFKWESFKMYFPLLAIMLVIIGLASFAEQFQNYYPLYAKSGSARFIKETAIPEWLAVLIFESAYGFNYLSIEFFFRGFLIYSFVRLLGPEVVLPMVCTYAALHFGKPFLEAFSSIFGGYILGVLALRTENIWGGVLLHAGIALLMEFFAWLH